MKQKRRIAKLAAKVGNQRADFLHKTANRLAARYDCVGVEDLDMKNMSQSLTLGKSTMDNGYGMFRTMLAYKLERQGKTAGHGRQVLPVQSTMLRLRIPQ